MTEIAETVNEAVEKAKESRLNTIIAALVAVTATFMALCNVKDGNIDQNMMRAQARANDTWALYQAKSTKQYLAEAAADELSTQLALMPAGAAGPKSMLEHKVAEYQARVARYDGEKEATKKQAEEFEKEYERLNQRDDQFDMADAGMSLGIALFGLTALTRKRWLFGVAIAFAGFGMLLGLAGFVGWNIHPEWVARVLG